MKYTLVRHLRSGKDAPVDDLTLSKARMYVALCLRDNGVASLEDAKKWAQQFDESKVGIRVQHVSGYAFTLIKLN